MAGDEPTSQAEKVIRLTRIVQRLEAKVKKIWDENNELKQQLQLAQLDSEIAQEQCASLTHELQEVRERMRELEELRELSAELETSYAADRQRLESEREALEAKINAVSLNTQKYEDLQLECASARRQLDLADLELKIVKHGAATALKPVLTSELKSDPQDLDWLPLIDLLGLDIAEIFSKYRKGQISLAILARLLAELVDKALDSPQAFDGVTFPETLETEFSDSSRWRRVLEESERRRNAQSESRDLAAKEKEQESKQDKAESQAMKLRISVLESKLDSARAVAQELDELHAWQKTARSREIDLTKQIKLYKETIEEKNSEVSELKRKNLPAELLSASHETEVLSLRAAIKFLSTNRQALVLDDLDELSRHAPISKLADNQRVRNLRKLAATFVLGESPEQAAALAIEQRAQLMFL